jgi:hypothetical protein
MAGQDKNRISTISGKSFDEVRDRLLRRTIGLKERIGLRYDQLYKDSLLDNVRVLLADLRTKEEEDTKLIRRALETGVIKIGNDKKPTLDYEMLDHIISEDLSDPNPNDLQSVLLSAMKMSNDLHKILMIMSEEYKVTGIGNVLKTLAEHEMNNKNRLAEIYDDMINKDYW